MKYLIIIAVLLYSINFTTGCKAYSFADVSVPDSIKTIRINIIENRAQYVNPQLSPNLTNRLQLRVNNQTRLSLTNNDNADWDVTGFISDYTPSTSGIANQQQTTNRLTVAVRITVTNRLSGQVQEHDVTRNFEFSADLSLQQAESQLLDEIVRNLTDDIFNRMFSNW